MHRPAADEVAGLFFFREGEQRDEDSDLHSISPPANISLHPSRPKGNDKRNNRDNQKQHDSPCDGHLSAKPFGSALSAMPMPWEVMFAMMRVIRSARMIVASMLTLVGGVWHCLKV